MAENEKKPSPPQRDMRFVVAGSLTVCVALSGFYASSLPQYIENEWLRMGSMILGVAGVIIFMFSNMEPEHRKDWLKQGLGALAIALLIRWSVGEPYRIPSSSMETTLHGDNRVGKGDRVFVNKFVYGLRYPFMNKRIWKGQDPQRWDIVVFKNVDPDAKHTTLVKRLVGLPGERINIRNGQVYINGEVLEFPEFMPEEMYYTYSGQYGVNSADEYSLIPEGHYLMLGDNSGNSRDGRVFGWLPESHIVGRVSSIWWPPARWRDFSGFSDTWWWRGLLITLAVYLLFRVLIGRSWSQPDDNSGKNIHYLMLFASYVLLIPFTHKILLRRASPERGDLVLYEPDSPLAEPGAMTCGYIIAMPGETVKITEEAVQVNDDALSLGSMEFSGYLSTSADAVYGSGKNKKHTVLPDDMYFILSGYPGVDAALDSRQLGFIHKDRILAKACCVWWPLSALKKVKP